MVGRSFASGYDVRRLKSRQNGTFFQLETAPRLLTSEVRVSGEEQYMMRACADFIILFLFLLWSGTSCFTYFLSVIYWF